MFNDFSYVQALYTRSLLSRTKLVDFYGIVIAPVFLIKKYITQLYVT